MRQDAEKTNAKGAKRGPKKAAQRSRESNAKRRQTIKQEGLSGDTVVSVRLKNAEFLEFSEQVAGLNVSNNEAFRIAARRIAGFMEIDKQSQQVLRDIEKQISGIARNINQMAKMANSVNRIDHKEYLKERLSLGQELARLSDQQQFLLNVGGRRLDGARRLQEAQDDIQ